VLNTVQNNEMTMADVDFLYHYILRTVLVLNQFVVVIERTPMMHCDIIQFNTTEKNISMG